MGIKYLNRFFKDEAPEFMKKIHLKQLYGKKIAVDISIFMYKYISENNLIENIYLMLSIFRYYNIIPIFIFDGKPPTEKKELLLKRREDKKLAEQEHNLLKNKLEINQNMDDFEKQEIINNMNNLKKQFVYLHREDIDNVKKLIRAYGATYYDALCEADELCALLTIKGKVWACLSEDMDMFVYGCPRVLRYFSLLNHNVILYDTNKIINKLSITQKELREICVLSGTDYNENNDSHNLYSSLKYFKKYKKTKYNDTFYNWLLQHTNYITDYDLLLKIYNMFDLTNYSHNLKVFENIKITNGQICKETLQNILD
jgi:flap endonuclease-1